MSQSIEFYLCYIHFLYAHTVHMYRYCAIFVLSYSFIMHLLFDIHETCFLHIVLVAVALTFSRTFFYNLLVKGHSLTEITLYWADNVYFHNVTQTQAVLQNGIGIYELGEFIQWEVIFYLSVYYWFNFPLIKHKLDFAALCEWE